MSKLRNTFLRFRAAFANMTHLDEHLHESIRFEILRERMAERVLTCTERGVTDTAYGPEPLIVTLTTHGNRINTVFQSVESIFMQTCKANRVVLHLSEDEFREEDLPVTLQRQMARGLEVRFVRDVGPQTKLVPALQAFPEALLVTIDDDIFYPIYTLERLIRLHRDHPGDVCCTVSRMLARSGDRGLKPFNDCIFTSLKKPASSMNYLAEGFAGVLYPPHCLHPDVVRDDLFRKLSPLADDLWFKAMEIRQGTKVCQMPGTNWMFYWTYVADATVQAEGLFHKNLYAGKNDEQLKALFDYYDLYDKLEG